MAYKCIECGHIFERGEERRWREEVGEYWGETCYDQMIGCPLCKGECEETVRCMVCGSEHIKEELHGDVCDECIDDYRKDFSSCYELSIGETTKIEINALLASLFDVSDIELILKEYIRDKRLDVDCSPFIDEDISWFGERLAEEVKKNENAKG